MSAEPTSRERAREFFANLRYESSRGGIRGLQEHHVDQFSESLAALLDAVAKEARAAALADSEKPAQTNHVRLSAMLYRSLERLSLAIEACGRIGFEESKPITNAAHREIWIDLNEVQKDAKLKLKHYAQFVATPPANVPAQGTIGYNQIVSAETHTHCPYCKEKLIPNSLHTCAGTQPAVPASVGADWAVETTAHIEDGKFIIDSSEVVAAQPAAAPASQKSDCKKCPHPHGSHGYAGKPEGCCTVLGCPCNPRTAEVPAEKWETFEDWYAQYEPGEGTVGCMRDAFAAARQQKERSA